MIRFRASKLLITLILTASIVFSLFTWLNLKPSQKLYINPGSIAAQARQDAIAAGRNEDARLIQKISDQPLALWISGEGSAQPDGTLKPVRQSVEDITQSAESKNQIAVLVAYNIPNRDCQGQSAGGAVDSKTYESYLNEFSAGLHGRDAIVILEPDAIAQAVQGCSRINQIERYRLILTAVETIKSADSRVKIFIDAGNPGFILDTSSLIEPLKQSGIEKADGFVLNVSNFYTDEDNIDYGSKLSRQLGGKPFIVDTSRNGRGPENKASGDPQPWCNPPGRALGHLPTLDPGIGGVYALLWIKNPGESDGLCKSGPFPGAWFPSRGLEMATNSCKD